MGVPEPVKDRLMNARRLFLALFLAMLSTAAYSDEGMWLVNAPPRELLQKKYGFDLTDAWLRRAQLASIRLNNGGSGSFISPNGLLITNHHVGSDALQKLSGAGKDLFKDGFLA
jgi:S1-C subfamily serine protease